jgi:hypothetical protein
MLFSVSDEDRQAKINGVPKAFLEGRQKALDEWVSARFCRDVSSGVARYTPNAPSEFKKFLETKQKENKQLLEFYTGEPDVSRRDPYSPTRECTERSVGRSPESPLQGCEGDVALGRHRDPRGRHPGAAEEQGTFRRRWYPWRARLWAHQRSIFNGSESWQFPVHIITWLARMASNAGVEPGAKAEVAMPKLKDMTGGHAFDPVVFKYWE